jgi:magnesium transporter
MIIAYTLSSGKTIKLNKVELTADDIIPKNVVWIDLIEPSIEEEKLVEKSLKIDAPTREEMDKIEVLSPFYKEDDSYFMTITAIHKADNDYPQGTAITMILHQQCLVTLRYSKPKAFNYFSARAIRNPSICTSPDLALEGIIEAIVHGLADILEKAGNEIDQLLADVFEKPKNLGSDGITTKIENELEEDGTSNNYYNILIKRVGRTGNLISKIRESLVSINRMLIFFGQIEDGKYMARKEHRIRFRNITREIHSLTEYANFLSQRNSFMLDATLGMINVEQNTIIKVFTVAAAVFLPPTLIASIYGMNFKFIPELEWVFGYPFSLMLMVLSAVLPYMFFKRKGCF